MKIESFKDFVKLVKLCRSNGVHTITVDGITMNIQLPVKAAKQKDIATEYFPEATIPVPRYSPKTGEVEAETVEAEELTEEQKMFYSATANPEAEVQ